MKDYGEYRGLDLPSFILKFVSPSQWAMAVRMNVRKLETKERVVWSSVKAKKIYFDHFLNLIIVKLI